MREGMGNNLETGVKNRLNLYRFLTTRLTHDDLYPHYSCGRTFSQSQIRSFWEKTARAIRNKKAPETLGLYVHIPFCRQKCRFCFCDSYVPKNSGVIKNYLELLKKELDAFKGAFRGVSFTSVYFGGGSPSFLANGDLESLIRHMKKCVRIKPDALFAFEAVPRDLSGGKLPLLVRYGMNCLIIGVQSLDPRVIRLMGRTQDKKEFFRIYQRARDLGVGYIQADLIAGLEGQSVKSFLSDLETLMDLKVDYINVTGFAPLEHTPFTRSGKKMTQAQEKTRFAMVRRSREILDPYHRMIRESRAGSCGCGGDKLCIDLRKEASSLLGIGYSAQSHAFGEAWYGHPQLLLMEKKPDFCALPPFYGIRGSADEEMRKFMFDNLKRNFSRRLFYSLFHRDVMDVFPREMKELVRRGLLKVEKDRVISLIREREDFLVYSKFFYSKKRIETLFRAFQKEFKKGKSYREELERMFPEKEER